MICCRICEKQISERDCFKFAFFSSFIYKLCWDCFCMTLSKLNITEDIYIWLSPNFRLFTNFDMWATYGDRKNVILNICKDYSHNYSDDEINRTYEIIYNLLKLDKLDGLAQLEE